MVKWKNYGSKQNTWELHKKLLEDDCGNLINYYEDNLFKVNNYLIEIIEKRIELTISK